MAETTPFKAYYGVNLAQLLASKLATTYPAFNAEGFVEQVAAAYEALELKGRVNLIRDALRVHLPTDYPAALEILLSILGDELPAEEGVFNLGYWVMPIAAFVQAYGLDHFEPSIRALYEITKRFSSEEAIRPYIVRHTQRILPILHDWTLDPSIHVRRLVSEGTRPRLPWAMRLQLFIDDPAPVLRLLEQLKDDPALYVRRSVANNLNDIAKDNPTAVIATLTRWSHDASENTRWLIRHALRHQVKLGDPAALAILGFQAEHGLTVSSFALSAETVAIGEAVTMTAEIVNEDSVAHQAVVDYAVHFVKASGKTSPKVFKWTTIQLAPGERVQIVKKHRFMDVSIRTHFPGAHRITLQVNGKHLTGATVHLSRAD